MTSPDTSTVRAWARSQGLAVAERGRLPAEVHAAYAAAHRGSAKPKKARPAAAPAKKARPAAAPTEDKARPVAPVEDAVRTPAPAAPEVDARVAALEEQVAALAARLAVLEQPAPASAKPSRFRRR